MEKLKIEYLKIDEIKPYANNAKEHPEEQIEQIINSIKEFGMDDPIGIWKNEIVEGHGRFMACQRLGIKEVPIIRLDHLTDEQRKAYALAHNKTTMSSGFNIEILEAELEALADEFQMDAFGFESVQDEMEVVEDNYQPEPEKIKEPNARPGDVYQLGRHRLMCGDSTSQADVETLMDGKSADLVITDPPYNVNYEEKEKRLLSFRPNARAETDVLTGIDNDNMDSAEFHNFLLDSFYNMKEALKDKRSFYIFFPTRNHVTFETALNETGLEMRQELIWSKNHFVLGRQDYQWKHEPIMYGWKDEADGSHYFINDRTQETVIEKEKPDFQKMKKSELIEWINKTYELPSTVMDIEKPLRNAQHPTMKPIKLIEILIRNSSKPGEIVLDLFGGSGSTMMAAEQMERACYMMEYDPKYTDIIIDRWESMTGGEAKLIKRANNG